MTMETIPSGQDIGEANLKLALDAFLKSPRRFENVKTLKDMIDDYVKGYAEKTAAVDKVATK